jgi:hypothetical protein
MPLLVIHNLIILFLLALTAAGTAVTISWSRIFRPLRLWLDEKGPEFLANLVFCHYCLGHWVALFFLLICPVAAIQASFFLVTWLVNYFLLASMTSFISTILMILIHYLKKLMDEKEQA